MQRYLASAERRAGLIIKKGENIKDDNAAFAVLIRSGVLSEDFDHKAIEGLLEKAPEEELPGYDYAWFLEMVESALRRLGGMPFDESALPPENPSTF